MTGIQINTQAVERAIKVVTEFCTAVCGRKERDGFTMNRLKSRKKMPEFNPKKRIQDLLNEDLISVIFY